MEDLTKIKFLITGGSGFLGYHLTRNLVREGYQVVVIDLLDNLPEDLKQFVRFYKVDVSSFKLRDIFKKERPQIIYHLAGPIALRLETDNPIFKKSLNILGNLSNILECCLKYGTEKIIFFSSGGAIYEDAKVIPTPESYPAHPISLYGLANLIIENYLKSYGFKHKLGFTILRFSNIYGPRQWKKGIVPSIITKLLLNTPPVIYGGGNQTRDFIFVEDAIRASLLAVKDKQNELYNVSSSKEISINEIFKEISKILKKRIKPIYYSSKIGDIKRSSLDNSKIKKELGWEPKIGINQGLKETVDWFRLNYVK